MNFKWPYDLDKGKIIYPCFTYEEDEFQRTHAIMRNRMIERIKAPGSVYSFIHSFIHFTNNSLNPSPLPNIWKTKVNKKNHRDVHSLVRRKYNKNVTVIKKKLVRKWNLKDKDIKDRALREEGERLEEKKVFQAEETAHSRKT